jgi:hypothetical protein
VFSVRCTGESLNSQQSARLHFPVDNASPSSYPSNPSLIPSEREEKARGSPDPPPSCAPFPGRIYWATSARTHACAHAHPRRRGRASNHHFQHLTAKSCHAVGISRDRERTDGRSQLIGLSHCAYVPGPAAAAAAALFLSSLDVSAAAHCSRRLAASRVASRSRSHEDNEDNLLVKEQGAN